MNTPAGEDIGVAYHLLNMAENGGMIDLRRQVVADDDKVHILSLEIAAIRNGLSLEEAFSLSEDDLDAAYLRLPEDVTRPTVIEVAAALAFRANNQHRDLEDIITDRFWLWQDEAAATTKKEPHEAAQDRRTR